MSHSLRAVSLAEIDLPEFGEPTVEPQIPAETYRARLDTLLLRAKEAGWDAIVVYGDREHLANVTYLTGYDPRFEETLLVIVPGRTPTLFVGNEGWSYTELAPGPFERVLFQSFSLPGQPRDRNRNIDDVLREAGLRDGMRIGAAGWKGFDEQDPGADAHWLEIPSYIADALRRIAGAGGGVVNATNLFMNPKDGLRAINDVDQLAAFEFSSTYSSQGLRNVLFSVRPGMTEIEAARLMRLTGRPTAAHIMLSGGRRATYGLPSPSLHKLERGEPFSMACTYWGSLNARAGFLAAGPEELPVGIRDWLDKLIVPYFRAAVDWYETIGIGVTGGEIFSVVERHLGDPFFGVSLNPGHLIHLDEWVHSPIVRGGKLPLRSGMALQIDIIPATGTPYFTTNIEDGIALADAGLRGEFAAKYPEAWSRIEQRRAFMQDVIGIRLKPEVLPFSNIPAYLTPFMLSPRKAMVARG
jgi:hypothetical protein